MPQLTLPDLLRTLARALDGQAGGAIACWVQAEAPPLVCEHCGTPQPSMTLVQPLASAQAQHTPHGHVALLLAGPQVPLTAAAVDRQAAQARDVAEHGALQCQQCGCTENVECAGGCWWVTTEPALCSRCAEGLDGADLQRLLR